MERLLAPNIRRAEYYYTSVKDEPGEAFKFLDGLAGQGVNLLAFSAVPTGHLTTQLMIFPDESSNLLSLAKKAGLNLFGPNQAFVVNGSNELGALRQIHSLLYQANINIQASNGVTTSKDNYGYIIYVRPEDFERAARALGI